jgi:uncharacterized protein (TIGR00251 family)
MRFFCVLSRGDMKISVRVKPHAGRNQVVKLEDGSFVVSVTAPPIEGKANKMIVELIAQHFGRPKSCVSIMKGKAGRFKIVEIT